MLLKEKRIFVVEDDAVNLSIITYLLRMHGATAFQDRWGVNALAAIRSALPLDLILLDLNFPNGVNGFDILCELKSDAVLKQIPVVAVSASGEMNRAREAGFSGYIGKPILPYAFANNVSNLVKGIPVWSDEQF